MGSFAAFCGSSPRGAYEFDVTGYVTRFMGRFLHRQGGVARDWFSDFACQNYRGRRSYSFRRSQQVHQFRTVGASSLPVSALCRGGPRTGWKITRYHSQIVQISRLHRFGRLRHCGTKEVGKRMVSILGQETADDTAHPRADKSKLATTRRGRVGKRPAAVMHPPRDQSVEKDNTPPAVSKEMRDRLRKKLQTIKDRVVPKPSHGGEVVHSSAEEDSSSGSADEDTEHAPECPDLTGGMTLAPQPPDLSTLGLTGEDRLAKVSKPSKKKKAVRPKELVTKGISSSSLRGQLVQRAVLATQAKRAQQKLRKKKKKKSSAKEKLSEALAKILTKSSKKKKKKKRKRRVNAEGIIESYSGSSSSSSESAVDEEDSSEQDLETPMRKRSRDHPGSVLRLLTDHVRDQLQQSATTELEDTENSITSGVKVMTYFMLQLRPHFQGHQREMRELHHLSACIDALCRGDVATTGDALAGRFIALRQSMIDQNWLTAKHMEIFPMEESSAASTAMVLATRKHSKLVMKAQGYQPTWNPRGKGRGKGEWSSWNDNKGDPKGEKGKGKKGKGKGKNKQTWGDPGQGGEWRDKKERPEEKQS